MSVSIEKTADAVQIQFALISHTNNGKTTLARTLVGMDIGEVRDAAHVTIFAESHTLLTTPQGDSLQLWDTPGFGDSVRLLKRLGQSGNPIGWFLREVLDRYRDRPFWLSQNALRTAKESADVVLYLVNSSENPRDAGYVPAEMKILEWIGKPVVVLLNQTGRPRPAAEEQTEQGRWREHLAQYPAVREVLALDAFARCWVHERVFYEVVGKLLDPSQQAGYARLFATWEAANARRYDHATRLLAKQLAAAARDSEAVDAVPSSMLKSALKVVGIGKNEEQQRQDRAMGNLIARLNQATVESTRELLILHQLDPTDAGKINERVRENFAVRAPIDKAQAGLLGAVISGAATGLSADVMAGGLTLGGGALLGGVVGALTFAGAAWGFNSSTDRNQAAVQFTDAFMRNLVVVGILRYLAVAHFGRGRGNFVENEAPAFWQEEVEQAVAQHDAALVTLWNDLRRDKADSEAATALIKRIATTTLVRLYPDVADRL
ncbi:GTPase domain-containing protein [Burkholderia sp. LMU1-1-1.1]|uniref:GTPase domain-containing protein n=1 Tax=Burkholderia sp. LMU1-1-1.1 TaxID=3135266 RepID=UPI003445F672